MAEVPRFRTVMVEDNVLYGFLLRRNAAQRDKWRKTGPISKIVAGKAFGAEILTYKDEVSNDATGREVLSIVGFNCDFIDILRIRKPGID